MINLQVFRMPWKLELCPSPHGPSSDRRTMLLYLCFLLLQYKGRRKAIPKKTKKITVQPDFLEFFGINIFRKEEIGSLFK